MFSLVWPACSKAAKVWHYAIITHIHTYIHTDMMARNDDATTRTGLVYFENRSIPSMIPF